LKLLRPGLVNTLDVTDNHLNLGGKDFLWMLQSLNKARAEVHDQVRSVAAGEEYITAAAE
jgi:hypothetical protein